MYGLNTHLYLIVKNDAKSIIFLLQLRTKDHFHSEKLEYVTTGIIETGRLRIKINFGIKFLNTFSALIKVNNTDLPRSTKDPGNNNSIIKDKAV